MKRETRNILLSVLAGTLLPCAIAGRTVYYYLFTPQSRPSKTVYVYVDQDDTADSVYNKIRQAGHVNKFTGLQQMAKHRKFDQNIRTGRYTIRPNENIYHVFSRFFRGYQKPMNPTIGSIRTLDRLTQGIGRQLMIDSAEIARQLFDFAFQTEMGYTPVIIPCLFTPETYQAYWGMSVDDFLKHMRTEHRRFQNDERLAQTAAVGTTQEEACTLASIIEEETNSNEEKPMVAELYIDRLHTGMPLQADPIIKFALQDFGLRCVTSEHLKVNSPYSTYINNGLPPGLVHIPSKKGSDSILNYTKRNYIYICVKEDFSGTHNFVSSCADHMVNARKHWKAFSERKIFE